MDFSNRENRARLEQELRQLLGPMPWPPTRVVDDLFTSFRIPRPASGAMAGRHGPTEATLADTNTIFYNNVLQPFAAEWRLFCQRGTQQLQDGPMFRFASQHTLRPEYAARTGDGLLARAPVSSRRPTIPTQSGWQAA